MKKSICTNCLKEFEHRIQCSTGKYCSNKCQQDYQSKQSLQKWLDGTWDGTKKGFSLSSTVRKYLLEQTNHHWLYANDHVWKRLQPPHHWFYFKKRIGKQRESYSDNKMCYVENNDGA